MIIKILTLFPEMFEPVLGSSILGKAAEKGLIDFRLVNIRDYTLDRHRRVDDAPFGGGAGMVMAVQPVFDALKSEAAEAGRLLYMSPKGRLLSGALAAELAGEEEIVFLCGHYEGIDQRIIDYWKIEEISIGDYILTGGELAAMVVIDAVARFIPGVLGNSDSLMEESVYSGLIEYPQYTRPRTWEGMSVPEVLLSGNHRLIDLWRFEQSCRITKEKRPDLWKRFLEASEELDLDKEHRKIIKKILENEYNIRDE